MLIRHGLDNRLRIKFLIPEISIIFDRKLPVEQLLLFYLAQIRFLTPNFWYNWCLYAYNYQPSCVIRMIPLSNKKRAVKEHSLNKENSYNAKPKIFFQRR